ncbi:hypothetical protein MZM54_22290 [[Brevibacterium] frigoritolerans]|nr:hypothetical protein [Peribacillus frigoritolerans]
MNFMLLLVSLVQIREFHAFTREFVQILVNFMLLLVSLKQILVNFMLLLVSLCKYS